MSTNAAEGRRKVVVAPNLDDRNGVSLLRFITVSVTSLGIHIGLILLFWYLPFSGDAQAGPVVTVAVKNTKEAPDVDEPETELDLSNIELGDGTGEEINYDVDRDKQEFSVPGEVNPDAPPGIRGGPEDAPKVSVPPPPGTGNGTGQAILGAEPGGGGIIGDPGGMGGSFYKAGGIGGRSGATKKKLLQMGGGNAASEVAVAKGLRWLAMHQAPDGHWALHEFDRHARTAPNGKPMSRCNCGGTSGRHNDTAATGFGLLPFLGAGFTHKGGPREGTKEDYRKTVDAGIKWLLKKQDKKTGYYGGDMYAHGIATIAICEAYGLTSDNKLKASAQMALNYIAKAQDPSGGGWRYTPRTPGDTSVTGWQLMAIKSGQMSGLSVPKSITHKADQFLDAVEHKAMVKGFNKPMGGGFSYVPNSGETHVMTAVGLLCRQYSGVTPKNPNLQAGVTRLRAHPPMATPNMYYLYYATQVMHHMGGEDWEFWNEGNPKGTGIRDMLIKHQFSDTNGRFPHRVGSWDPGLSGVGDGGRIMATSLSLLSLEVYYRHLPLYRREMAVTKPGK